MRNPFLVSQLLALVRLDLKLFFRDRRALMLVFAVPIGIASFVGALTSGATRGESRDRAGLNLVIADLDHSAMSRAVIEQFRSDPTFRVTETNEPTARSWVLTGKIPVAIVLPENFGTDALPGLINPSRKPKLTLLFDPSHTLERQMVEGMLVPKVLSAMAQNAFTLEAAQDWVGTGLKRVTESPQLSAADRQRLRELLLTTEAWLKSRTNAPNSSLLTRTGSSSTAGSSLPLPFTTEATPLTEGQASYNGYAHSFAGMGVQFILMSMIDLAVNLLRERESGVFRRLRSTPLSRATLLAAKALSWGTISFLSLTACFTFAMIVFHVRVEGSWIGFLAMLVATSLMAGTLGLALAGVGRTPAGTRGFAIALILFLVMIGGAWMPTFLFPKWLQQISVFAPTRWALDGLDAMTWRGLGLQAVLGPLVVTLLFAAGFAALAWRKFKWEA